MDYTPQHSQPFTVREAINFDVPVITEEIDRLEISLYKLRETQGFLQSYLEASPDAEISQVLEENEVVMESQKERITILKMALTEKGVLSTHYESTPPNIDHSQPVDSASQTTSSGSPRQNEEIEVPVGRGVYL